MSWEELKCPHCGYKRPITVNQNVKESLKNCTCSKCHKPYAYQATYGKITIIKK